MHEMRQNSPNASISAIILSGRRTLTMRRSLAVLTIAGLLLVKAPVNANEPLLGLFRDYLESLRVQAGIPGLSAALVGRDDIIWEHAFGWADTEQFIAATTDTPFHVDGVTQLFTSTLVLQCVEHGLFALDTPIGEFSRSSPEPQATFRQVLTHTSGDQNDPVFAYSPRSARVCCRPQFEEVARGTHSAKRSRTNWNCWA